MILRIIVFYIFTWFFTILLGGIQQQTRILPAEIGLAQWGPGVAALVMLLIFRKDHFKINFFSTKTPFARYLIAALLPAVTSLVLLLIVRVLNLTGEGTLSPSPVVTNSLLIMALWAPLGALGEEIGWRGYLHKKLDTRMRGLLSSVLVGLLWMPFHIHFLNQGVVFLAWFLLLLISYSIVIYALVQDNGFNVLLATVFHLSVNLGNLLFLDVVYQTSFMMINAVVWALIAAGFVVVKRQLFFETS